jgi:hypothetical protein
MRNRVKGPPVGDGFDGHRRQGDNSFLVGFAMRSEYALSFALDKVLPPGGGDFSAPEPTGHHQRHLRSVLIEYIDFYNHA